MGEKANEWSSHLGPYIADAPFTAALSRIALGTAGPQKRPVQSSADGWPPVLLEAPGLETVEVSGAHDESPRGRVYEMRGCFSLATLDSIIKVFWQAMDLLFRIVSGWEKAQGHWIETPSKSNHLF